MMVARSEYSCVLQAMKILWPTVARLANANE
jgi:hypothetical protein